MRWLPPALLALLALVATAAAPAAALAAGGTVVLVDGSKVQYRQTAQALRRSVRGPVALIDVGRADDPVAAARREQPRVIVAVGQKALALVAGRVTDTPIVYGTVLYPERHGLTGKNITGVPLEIPAATQLAQFKKVSPRLRRLGVIYSRESGRIVEEASAAAPGLGLQIVAKAVTSPREVGDAFEDIADRIDALWLLPDAKVISNKDVFAYLLRATLDRGVPLFGFLDAFTEKGALASISPDYADIGVRTSVLVNQILGGTPPADAVPPKAYSPGSLSVNLKTAERLGIRVSDRTIRSAKTVYR